LQSSDSDSKNGKIPVSRAKEVVVGAISTPNSSSSSASSGHTPPLVEEESTAFVATSHHPPDFGSLKNVNSPYSASPVPEETTPLLSRHSEKSINNSNPDQKKVSEKHYNRRRFAMPFSLLLVVAVVLVLTSVVVCVVYECGPLDDSRKTAILQNKNDTIVAFQVETKRTGEITLQLVQEKTQSLNVVHIYSTPCNKLLTHSSTEHHLSSPMRIDGSVKILFPTYLVRGSELDINSFVLNSSSITVEIELYIFSGLNMVKNFAANLENSVYRATIYTSGSGVQNTSTNVNYTVRDTDYYFIIVDSTAPIYAEFDTTVHRKYYDPADYKQSCVIEHKSLCRQSYHTSFQNKQECILAHATYIRDTQWVPAYIQVTLQPQRNTKTSVIVMSSVGGFSVLSLIFFTFCGFYRLCKRSLSKGTIE
jgi:hypothetical protein